MLTSFFWLTMRSFLNIKNINTIFLLLLILVSIYLINTDLQEVNTVHLCMLPENSHSTKHNYLVEKKFKNQKTYLIVRFYVLPSYKSSREN